MKQNSSPSAEKPFWRRGGISIGEYHDFDPIHTPCCFGTFEGFNHRDQSAIEAVLTADEVVAGNHDDRGEAEIWPSADAPTLTEIVTRHVTVPELLTVRRRVAEVGVVGEIVLLRFQFACNVLGEHLRELTMDALDDQQPSIFFGRNRWDAR